ncbi:MAG: hypothetical protein M0R44_11370 [Candidatus Marinimicrobia bacterium]|jgi:hypothetical protein|nr:hypothetical protein [Candidatus Neomarinimicrobiota bacterium]
MISNKTFNKSPEEIKTLIDNIKQKSPYMESRDCIFYRGVQYLAEILINPKRADNLKLFK